jgi:transposase
LVKYANHGLLETSNATAENALRPVAVGRKSWLFASSNLGGHTAAVLFSLMASCKQNQVNPWQWLAYVLEVLPTTEPASLSGSATVPVHRPFPAVRG